MDANLSELANWFRRRSRVRANSPPYDYGMETGTHAVRLMLSGPNQPRLSGDGGRKSPEWMARYGLSSSFSMHACDHTTR